MSSYAPRAARQTSTGPVTPINQKIFTKADIATSSVALPKRYALYAAVGFGKTSLAAFAPRPIFLETRSETGLEVLIAEGQLPPTPFLPELMTWDDILAAVRFLRTEDHGHRTLVIDTLNGAERLLHEYICERDYGGIWGDGGFGSYQKGYEVALADWRLFLDSLDALRREKGMTIFTLLHMKVKTFKNPNGADYDRYAPEMHDKTWTLTKGWLDCILFGNFEVVVTQAGKKQDTHKKGKAAELTHRMLYTNSDNPTFDAKNRLGLPDEIDVGGGPQEGWKAFAAALKESRAAAPVAAPAAEVVA